MSNLAFGNTDAVLFYVISNLIRFLEPGSAATEAVGRREFAYLLQKARGQVLVNGKFPLLLLGQTRLDGGFLDGHQS